MHQFVCSLNEHPRSSHQVPSPGMDTGLCRYEGISLVTGNYYPALYIKKKETSLKVECSGKHCFSNISLTPNHGLCTLNNLDLPKQTSKNRKWRQKRTKKEKCRERGRKRRGRRMRYICLSVYMYVCTYVCLCEYMYFRSMCFCVCVFVYISIYVHV